MFGLKRIHFNCGLPELPQRGDKNINLEVLQGFQLTCEIQAYLQWQHIGSMPGKMRPAV